MQLIFRPLGYGTFLIPWFMADPTDLVMSIGGRAVHYRTAGHDARWSGFPNAAGPSERDR
jgi:hypothetical protein